MLIIKYLDSIKFPNTKDVNSDIASYLSVYPFNIFFENEFVWLLLRDITILYGNNGSGKSTVLNIIADKLKAKRNKELYKEVMYLENGTKFCPMSDFIDMTTIKVLEKYDNVELITSDDIFNEIDKRIKRNNKILDQIEEVRKDRDKIYKSNFKYHDLSDYEELVKYNEVMRSTKIDYVRRHTDKIHKIDSNGQTALAYFDEIFAGGGIFLLDEPENCLSPRFQIELMNLIYDAVKYYDCQFIISTHSPIILSLENALIYNLDKRPVIEDDWANLDNVKLYYSFFKKHEKDFL